VVLKKDEEHYLDELYVKWRSTA